MAKGRDQHQARIEAISLFGKDLARRASRKCELCKGSGDLRPYDTAPDAEPSFASLALFCERCRGLADGGKTATDGLRFLEEAVWSDIPAVGDTARTIIGRVDADWARATLATLS